MFRADRRSLLQLQLRVQGGQTLLAPAPGSMFRADRRSLLQLQALCSGRTDTPCSSSMFSCSGRTGIFGQGSPRACVRGVGGEVTKTHDVRRHCCHWRRRRALIGPRPSLRTPCIHFTRCQGRRRPRGAGIGRRAVTQSPSASGKVGRAEPRLRLLFSIPTLSVSVSLSLPPLSSHRHSPALCKGESGGKANNSMYGAKELSSAAVLGNWREVKRLLNEEKVNVNAVNKYGHTALQVMMMGCSFVAEELLKNGADPNIQDKNGFTPAHDVARTGFLDTMMVLVEYGANMDIKDASGCLPIHLAAQEGHLGLVQFLATKSCFWRKNSSGHTALDMARASGRTEVAEWLEEYLQATGTQFLH
ncbi:ankyrin-3-like [Leucoraja erinacea]|uniref:ankyrin-3-like n=1 Tax=Leucoraja erinaceus TaxID=7782 RepID=UPI00245553D3|nr:ankyrin-3-like [Leucoraja erinacea]